MAGQSATEQIANGIAITGLGAISPVGANAEQTCSSIRAGIARITEHAYYECTPQDPEWDEELPLYAGSVEIIDPFLDGPERLFQLAIPAITDLMANSKMKRGDLQAGGLFLSLPQADTAVKPWRLEQHFIPELCRRTGLEGFRLTKTNQSGRAGMFTLVAEAIKLLNAGGIDHCIVGGVESYLLEDRLDLLDKAGRIKSDRNVDGFVPGEAAVMVLLETPEHAKQRGVPVNAIIAEPGFGHEPETIHSDQASTGLGLTAALEGLLQTKPDDYGFPWVYCDLNGESYYVFEWGSIITRLAAPFSNLKKLIHPADCVGDVGAATGGLLLACATKAFQWGYNIADEALLWTASDSGDRAALTLRGNMD